MDESNGGEFDYSLGVPSSLAEVYDRDGDVLLLGVGHDVNTSLHLAEYRADVETGTVVNDAPIRDDGQRIRVEYEDVDPSTEDFANLGADFERHVGLTEATVGAATAELADQRTLVDFAAEWVETNR